MTEAEWLACTDPNPMLRHLGERLSDRKARLYSCAWARRRWDRLLDERSRAAVETAERHADGLATERELLAAFEAADAAWMEVPVYSGSRRAMRQRERGRESERAARQLARKAADPALSRRNVGWAHKAKSMLFLADALRELFGPLPFRSFLGTAEWLAWNAGAVAALAQDVHERQAFDEMPILADALEDAGCTEGDVLAHCRQREAHLRGCWVIDLLLGKE
jgi:hypothetical protein